MLWVTMSNATLPQWLGAAIMDISAQEETVTCLSYSPGCNDRDPGSELIRMVTNQPINTREQGLVTRDDGTFLKNVTGDEAVSTSARSSEPWLIVHLPLILLGLHCAQLTRRRRWLSCPKLVSKDTNPWQLLGYHKRSLFWVMTKTRFLHKHRKQPTERQLTTGLLWEEDMKSAQFWAILSLWSVNSQHWHLTPLPFWVSARHPSWRSAASLELLSDILENWPEGHHNLRWCRMDPKGWSSTLTMRASPALLYTSPYSGTVSSLRQASQ